MPYGYVFRFVGHSETHSHTKSHYTRKFCRQQTARSVGVTLLCTMIESPDTVWIRWIDYGTVDGALPLSPCFLLDLVFPATSPCDGFNITVTISVSAQS